MALFTPFRFSQCSGSPALYRNIADTLQVFSTHFPILSTEKRLVYYLHPENTLPAADRELPLFRGFPQYICNILNSQKKRPTLSATSGGMKAAIDGFLDTIAVKEKILAKSAIVRGIYKTSDHPNF